MRELYGHCAGLEGADEGIPGLIKLLQPVALRQDDLSVEFLRSFLQLARMMRVNQVASMPVMIALVHFFGNDAWSKELRSDVFAVMSELLEAKKLKGGIIAASFIGDLMNSPPITEEQFGKIVQYIDERLDDDGLFKRDLHNIVGIIGDMDQYVEYLPANLDGILSIANKIIHYGDYCAREALRRYRVVTRADAAPMNEVIHVQSRLIVSFQLILRNENLQPEVREALEDAIRRLSEVAGVSEAGVSGLAAEANRIAEARAALEAVVNVVAEVDENPPVAEEEEIAEARVALEDLNEQAGNLFQRYGRLLGLEGVAGLLSRIAYAIYFSEHRGNEEDEEL